MKKFFSHLVLVVLFINLGLTAQQMTFAANAPTQSGEVLSPIQQLQNIGEKSKLPSFDVTSQHPDAPPDYLNPGAGVLSSPVYFTIDLARFFLSGIALLIIIFSAVKLMVIANEDEFGKAKSSMIWGTAGLVLVQLADVIVKKMFFGEQGEAFEDLGTSQLFAEETVTTIRGLIGLVQFFLGAIAVLVIIARGFTLLVSVGEEEALNKAKSHIGYAVAGLIIIGLSEVVIRGFIFPEAGTVLPKGQVGKAILISITNFISGFIAIIAFVSLVFSGYRYVASAGNDEVTEKVKKTALSATIALLLALGAFAFVQTFVTLEARPDEDPQALEQVQPGIVEN